MNLPRAASDGVVRLRPLRAEDAAAYAGAFVDDPDLGRRRGLDRDPDEASFLTGLGEAVGEDFAELAIADADDVLVGSVILHSLDWRHRRGEIGYWLVADARGLGLGTRALRLVLRWMFEDLGLERAEIATTPDNPASLALARRFGFTEEGLMRGRDVERGERVDVVLLGLLREEWRG